MARRVLGREELVARMLADQELRKRKERMLRVRAADDIAVMTGRRREKYLRNVAKRGRR